MAKRIITTENLEEDYKIENNMLKVEIKQAGWTDRQYNKM